MSRQDEIKEAGKFLGLAAAHWACYGEAWPEVDDYRDRAYDLLERITFNEHEYQMCNDTAATRAAKYINRTFSIPRKILIPATAQDALQQAYTDVAAMLAPYKP